ncbi:MAG TPA: hypothetical protein VFV30_06780 [Novosphingobium sp.]|nr:hypothetical protein [Novosphingobium sp.]
MSAPTESASALELPGRVVWFGNQPVLEWRRLDLADALGPRFYESALKAPVVRIQALDTIPEEGLERVAGLILHAWRCGSTLLCALFNTAPRTVALSEPSCFSDLLVGIEQEPALAAARIRKLAACFGHALAGVADRVVIKLPGLLAQHAEEIEDALPEVPVIFLHREAGAVVQSLLREPIGNLSAAPARYRGSMPASAAPESLLFTASIIAENTRAIAKTRRVHCCDYRHLPALTWQGIAGHFGLALSEADCQRMAEAAQWHSKFRPGVRRFTGDAAVDPVPGAEQAVAVIASALHYLEEAGPLVIEGVE